MKYVMVGLELQNFFAGILRDAPKDCLCHRRAAVLNVMGPQWCRDNVKYIVSWIEEEADHRSLFEDEQLRERMRRYMRRLLRRKSRMLAWIGTAFADRAMNKPGSARSLLIKRLVLLIIYQAERRVRVAKSCQKT